MTALLAELLRRGRPVRLVARGGSMWPWLCDGSVVRIEPRQPRVGEIAAALHQGELLLHRVVARSPRSLALRGDALDRIDEVPYAQVLGAVASRAAPLVPATRLLARLRRRWRKAICK